MDQINLNVFGGTIHNCVANDSGGAVYHKYFKSNSKNSDLSLSCAVNLYENKSFSGSVNNDIYYDDSARNLPIQINDEDDESENIMTFDSTPTALLEGGISARILRHFVSGKEGYVLITKSATEVGFKSLTELDPNVKLSDGELNGHVYKYDGMTHGAIINCEISGGDETLEQTDYNFVHKKDGVALADGQYPTLPGRYTANFSLTTDGVQKFRLTGTTSAIFEITKNAISVTVDAIDTTYTGNQYSATITSSGNLVDEWTKDVEYTIKYEGVFGTAYSLSDNPPNAVGDYKVTLALTNSGIEKYTINGQNEVSDTFSIGKQPLTI